LIYHQRSRNWKKEKCQIENNNKKRKKKMAHGQAAVAYVLEHAGTNTKFEGSPATGVRQID
jgi:hypothetical protein